MTFYYPKEFFDNSARWHIFPLLKSLLKEAQNMTEDFSMSESLEKADFVIIPMSWNYYYRCNKIAQVLEYYSQLPNKKQVISFVFGDFGVKVPSVYKGLVFRASGYKSKLPENHVGLPVFIEDPLKKHYNQEIIFNKPYSKEAIIGFCGQAKSLGLHNIEDYLKLGLKNMLSIIGYGNRDLEPLMSATYLRFQILKSLKRSNNVICNFIIRKKYRAGITLEKDQHSSTQEFYENINNSDYILCVRGAGNFSTRFYETLAMGRIPVFVNTDCLLPLSHIIDWEKHVVWVEYNERHLIAEKIAGFHSLHDETSLNQLFLKNRQLWKEHIQLYSFFNTFLNAD
ncbi:exostosin family protein [Xanthomarina sp. GH4-25]|uniref:exostosin domain-containing protein n=1 Tax=Xanthomarina sp. GH4-25 TaxID=3349335 RepID=UPI003877FB2C